MSRGGIPSFLDHPEPYREIRLRGLEDHHLLDEDTGERYERVVWGRPCSEGWTGWHYREHMTTAVRVIWPAGAWEEIK